MSNLENNFNLDETGDTANIQPHLGSLQIMQSPTSLEQVNPAFEDDFTSDEASKHQNNNDKSSTESTNPATRNENGDVLNTSCPVVYSNTGQNGVTQERIIIQKPDGTRTINTEQCTDYTMRYRKKQKPLRKERITRLKILSVLSLFVFFPLGIPAVYFAFNTQKEFDAGILQGNIDKAQKYASRAEKLVIFSVIFAILTAVVVFAVVDRIRNSNDDPYNAPNRLLPAG